MVIAYLNPLKWLINIKDPAGRLARWSLTLQEYDITIQHQARFIRVQMHYRVYPLWREQVLRIKPTVKYKGSDLIKMFETDKEPILICLPLSRTLKLVSYPSPRPKLVKPSFCQMIMNYLMMTYWTICGNLDRRDEESCWDVN